MFDEEQVGFLAGDEYQRAAELRVREESGTRPVCDNGDPAIARPCSLDETLAGLRGRWDDDDPPTVPQPVPGPGVGR